MTMKTYVVLTVATVKRRYEVAAHDIEDALKDFGNHDPVSTEDADEETYSIQPLE